MLAYERGSMSHAISHANPRGQHDPALANVFCLWYATQLPDPAVVRHLIIEGLRWGGLAGIVLYCQMKYLDA